MISPLIPFAIKGVIWYQGEANAGRAYQYRKAFPLMITDWRKHWGQGDFPFYFVQLASFNAGDDNNSQGSSWAELREAQTLTLSLPNTGMAVTTDIGNPTDIHPKNKQEVGRRLGAIALSQLYGKKMEYSGPVFKSMKISGNKISISFTHLGSGLMVKDKGSPLKGFEIAGADQQFHTCKANIDGDHVVLSLDGLNQPLAARYAWANNAGDANLFNQDGYPAVSFRTDQWKGITEGVKYSFGN
jgi:sialate O-acetylesterase